MTETGGSPIPDYHVFSSPADLKAQMPLSPEAAASVARGRAEARAVGVMLESFLIAGRQEPGDPAGLVYGQSVTGACMDFTTTTAVLQTLAAAAVHLRRRGGSR